MPSPHPLRLTVLIRMTKRKMATIDSHTPLWATLAHFNSVLMHHVSIKMLIMWQLRPQGQIASNRLGVMFGRMSSLEASDDVCGLSDVCVSCSFWVYTEGLNICAKSKRSFCSCQKTSAVLLSVWTRTRAALFAERCVWGSYLSEESLNHGVRGHGVKGGPEVWSVSPWVSRLMSAI